MNSLPEIPYINDRKEWYFISIFYARENWAELVSRINQFYQERKTEFCNCLLSFSEDKGEQIEISLASYSSGQKNRKEEIEQFFLSLLEHYPSERKINFPYGKAVWCNYPNNTLLWFRFRTMDLSDHYVNFHQLSFHLVMSLIENDTSPDTLFSVCLYLITKGLTCIDPEKQKTMLSNALHESSTDFKNYAHVDSVKNLIVEHLDLQEIDSTLESYWNESEAEFSPELKVWIASVKEFTINYSFTQFCSSVCKMVGLTGLHQLMVLELVNTWYNSRCNEND